WGQNSRPVPVAVTPGKASEPAWLARLDGRQRRMIVLGVALAALTRYLASRRFLATVIVGVVGVRALGTLGKESEGRTIARVVAWDRARAQRTLKAAEHGHRGRRKQVSG